MWGCECDILLPERGSLTQAIPRAACKGCAGRWAQCPISAALTKKKKKKKKKKSRVEQRVSWLALV